ncbi:MAG: hypothetical protein ACI9WU_002556 [Myxococcota bacterium]|jgi:hypothetical protein
MQAFVGSQGKERHGGGCGQLPDAVADVRCDPQRIRGFEGSSAAEQLVQRGTQRIQIRSGIHAPIHPAGLLRGDVRQRSLKPARTVRAGRLPLLER